MRYDPLGVRAVKHSHAFNRANNSPVGVSANTGKHFGRLTVYDARVPRFKRDVFTVFK